MLFNDVRNAGVGCGKRNRAVGGQQNARNRQPKAAQVVWGERVVYVCHVVKKKYEVSTAPRDGWR